MIFNATLIYALTISNFCGHSPFISLIPMHGRSIFQMKALKFTNFFTNSLNVHHLHQSISVENCQFTNFLKSAISVHSETTDECIVHPLKEHINSQVSFQSCIQVLNSTFTNSFVVYENGGSINCILTNPNYYFLVDRCNFTGSKATSNGGAIYFIGSNESTQYNAISYCIFNKCAVNNNNNNIEGNGGSVYCDASSVNFRNSIFNESTITNNGKGGAIYAKLNSIENDTFITNFINCSIKGSNSYGGALFISLKDKSKYNMSYINFENCTASNGQCAYLENISYLNINYISMNGINESLIMVEDLDFNFSFDNIILYDENYGVKLINATNISYYNGPKEFMFDYYGKLPSDISEFPDFLIDRSIVNLIVMSSKSLNYYTGYPFVPPPNASTPLDEAEMISGISPTISNPDISFTASNGQSYTETRSSTVSVTENVTPSISDNFSQTDDVVVVPVANNGSSLSTVAIIFIVIACLIVVVAIVVFVIFYLRSHGGCQGNDLNTRMKNSTYF